MSLWNGTICLQPDISSETTDEKSLEDIWKDVSRYSVEIVAANRGGVFDFIENDCMYFAAIQLLSKEDVKQWNHGDASDAPLEARNCCNRTSCSCRITEKGKAKASQSQKPITIGFIYLTSSHMPSTVNLGFAITPSSRRRGYATQAVRMLLPWVFNELQCHRAQVNVAADDKGHHNAAASLLTSIGFAYEGVNRRAIFCPSEGENGPPEVIGEWRDVNVFAMLDTEGVMCSNRTFVPSNFIKMRWEELFDRQESERRLMVSLEEMLDRHRMSERRMSVEAVTAIPTLPLFDDSDSTDCRVDSSPENPQVEIPLMFDTARHVPTGTPLFRSSSPPDFFASDDYDEEDAESFFDTTSSPMPRVSLPSSASSLAPDLQLDFEVESVSRSPSVTCSTGSASSWDMWETSSTASFVSNMSGRSFEE